MQSDKSIWRSAKLFSRFTNQHVSNGLLRQAVSGRPKSSPDGDLFCRGALFACSPAARRAAKSVRKALLRKAAETDVHAAVFGMKIGGLRPSDTSQGGDSLKRSASAGHFAFQGRHGNHTPDAPAHRQRPHGGTGKPRHHQPHRKSAKGERRQADYKLAMRRQNRRRRVSFHQKSVHQKNRQSARRGRCDCLSSAAFLCPRRDHTEGSKPFGLAQRFTKGNQSSAPISTKPLSGLQVPGISDVSSALPLEHPAK